jgi:hypothetical protein
MADVAGMRVIVMGHVVDAAHPSRCQVAERTSALEELTVWVRMRYPPLHLWLSGHLVSAVVVSCVAVEATGNASDDLGRLERKGKDCRMLSV